MELVPGAKAPDFTLPCDGGGRVAPADFKGADGRIARSWPKVKVEGHAEEVLHAAKSL